MPVVYLQQSCSRNKVINFLVLESSSACPAWMTFWCISFLIFYYCPSCLPFQCFDFSLLLDLFIDPMFLLFITIRFVCLYCVAIHPISKAVNWLLQGVRGRFARHLSTILMFDSLRVTGHKILFQMVCGIQRILFWSMPLPSHHILVVVIFGYTTIIL